MKLYAFHLAKAGKKPKDSVVSKLVGVAPETICRWKKINGFLEWLEEAQAAYKTPINALLEQKALEMIQAGDFRFWDAVARKHNYYSSSEYGPRVLQLAYSID